MINPANVTLTPLDPNRWMYRQLDLYCRNDNDDRECDRIPDWDGSLSKLLLDEFGVDGLQNESHSLIIDSNFERIEGDYASALYLEDTNLQIHDSNFLFNRAMKR